MCDRHQVKPAVATGDSQLAASLVRVRVMVGKWPAWLLVFGLRVVSALPVSSHVYLAVRACVCVCVDPLWASHV